MSEQEDMHNNNVIFKKKEGIRKRIQREEKSN